MSRRVVWLQLLIGWLPVWALITLLISSAHGVPFMNAAHVATRMVGAAAVLGFLVQRLTERVAWPRRVSPGFVAFHLVAAVAYALAWLTLNSLVESVLRGQLVIAVGYSFTSFIVLGIWLYVMIAGVAYTTQATERAARAEAAAVRAQLSALRAQLNPHFLFNALHTVVQLIPREPRRAADAAEQLAGLLRTAVEEDRDLVTLAEELAFVERYLDLERVRFGDRLRVTIRVSDAARDALVPSFSVQTLVENAVRHGAAPRVEPTDVLIRGERNDGSLTVTVSDSGVGSSAEALSAFDGAGTGLRRLRERLAALYPTGAQLDVVSAPTGVTATLVVPQERSD